MTSRIDAIKTNEFLLRRKLRLQQVREQSKDIAKKIRQRAKVENFRHLDQIDAKKAKEYFDSQEKFVKHLEFLYSEGLQNVGASHKNALDVDHQDIIQKIDASKQRGKEATAELRKKKQEKLDEQKKILDRKLQAREVANELSREKSTTVTKNLSKQISKKSENSERKLGNTTNTPKKEESNKNQDVRIDILDVTKNDMGTQWESEELPDEWGEPNVPALSLPEDESNKDFSNENTEKTDKNKRLNLFALSDEMPTSLRGGLSSVIDDAVPTKSSLTVVSEYLQNRNLKLRQADCNLTKKSNDLQSIKETILRTRATRANGNVFDNVCHVLDEQIIPVPSWQAEVGYDLCRDQYLYSYHRKQIKKSCSRAPVNKFPSSPTSLERNLQSSRAIKELNLYKRANVLCGTCKKTGSKDKSSHSTELSTDINRRKSILVYNHNTRNTQDMPCSDNNVSHDNKLDEDAYSQAFKETTIANSLEKKQLNKLLEDARTKVAVTKTNVDKEYKDTLAFLNTLKKDSSDKPTKSTYMDDRQQQMRNERHQNKLQREFKNIEKECHKNNVCKHSKRKASSYGKESQPRSPEQTEDLSKNFEYSWMPVPESDGNLAIHTIPSTRNKSRNSVKFCQPDSYHEYRSRHKHTPPTKDVSNDRQNNRVLETVILEQGCNDSDTNESSLASDTSSVDNLNLNKSNNLNEPEMMEDPRLKDAEKIIIYKILESKKHEKRKDHIMSKDKKITNDVKKKVKGPLDVKKKTKSLEKSVSDVQRGGCLEQIQEGVYEAKTSNGDNITSMYFTEYSKQGEQENPSTNRMKSTCCCKNKDSQHEGDNITRLIKETDNCKCKFGSKINENHNFAQPSAATSATSFTTALNDKTNLRLPGDGFVTLLDDGGQEKNKFYIGASGFLKDDNYEVVIQLRKKETEKVNIESKSPSLHTQTVQSTDVETQEIEQKVSDSVSYNTIEKERPESMIKVLTDSDAMHDSQQSNEQKVSKEPSEIEIISVEAKLDSQSNKMCEKAVYTSFQDSFAIPAHVPKSDPTSRPATSTYTQTSFNSSMPRPAFMHMSSSTSTAYMSPPELILPKFLKQNYILSKEELSESENTMNQLDSNFEVMEHENCNKCKDCRCCEKYQLKTPPNTARSLNKGKPPSVSSIEKGKVKYKCHKCRSRSETNISKSRKTNSSMLKTKSLRDLSSDNFNPISKSLKNKIANTRPSTKISGNKINPVVKNYVNKLLALNKEGLKAIEVINQDCSSITTPSSSIVNVPYNRNKNARVESKISLEQIKNILRQQVLQEDLVQKRSTIGSNRTSKEIQTEKVLSKIPKKKSVHKVKSLYISKHISKKKKPYDCFMSSTRGFKKHPAFIPSTAKEENKISHHQLTHSKGSTTPRTYDNNSEYKNSTSSDVGESLENKPFIKNINKAVLNNQKRKNTMSIKSQQKKNLNLPSHRVTGNSFASDSDAAGTVFKHLQNPQPPIHISTQTNGIVDAEMNFMKIAEDKLQNMEKIADLTEKCTKRLSNLAKVLEEVRKNKSLVYSQISASDSAPESEGKQDKNETSISEPISDPCILPQRMEIATSKEPEKHVYEKKSAEFISFLKDIPKPEMFTTPLTESSNVNDLSLNIKKLCIESENNKSRGKPPPALTRVNLKHGQDVGIIPHELSTVIEVDSPMSVKFKSSSRHDIKLDMLEKSEHIPNENNDHDHSIINGGELVVSKESKVNPDLLQSNINSSKRFSKVSNDSSDESKIRMMDMKKFNDIMLKPFISLKEYAKQCKIGLDDRSNPEEVVDEQMNDDLSSLHSDGSLPDVIAELLKRNIISEPFKFDTGSNVNSTTWSSESTLSVLALSKAKKEKTKPGMFLKNKENIAETSETLSISSNPDLENAFQKLGMGWASSTLKKTKERLALSSSSNTSSSSMTQFKIKSFNQDVPPPLASDTTSSLLDVSKKCQEKHSRYQTLDVSRNAVQQTSLTNSMTVKEFLTNELAKKITFNNKSSRREAEEEFVSLYETRIPDEMKHTNIRSDEDKDKLSVANLSHNRARTSTPVQIFKSQTYHSSSTSNTSNGIFSNADDISSVKVTSASIRNHSTSDKDDLTIPNYSLKTKKGQSNCSKSD